MGKNYCVMVEFRKVEKRFMMLETISERGKRKRKRKRKTKMLRSFLRIIHLLVEIIADKGFKVSWVRLMSDVELVLRLIFSILDFLDGIFNFCMLVVGLVYNDCCKICENVKKSPLICERISGVLQVT
jgi:hypothetical protein